MEWGGFVVVIALALLCLTIWYLSDWLFISRPLCHLVVESDSSHVKLKDVKPVSGKLPFIGCGLEFIKNPAQFLQSCRQKHGETFLLHMFGIQMLMTFSAEGLQSLYSIRENQASFAEATKGLLGLKIPRRALEGSMKTFHQILKPSMLNRHIPMIRYCVDKQIDELPAEGEFEIFTYFKDLVHRVGFLCWIGADALEKSNFSALKGAFERLDPEQGFKNLSDLGRTLATGKYDEEKALKDMAKILKRLWIKRSEEKATGKNDDPNAYDATENLDDIDDSLGILYYTNSDVKDLESRYDRMAIDIFQFHVASQANLYAALSWILIRLLTDSAACQIDQILESIEALNKSYATSSSSVATATSSQSTSSSTSSLWKKPAERFPSVSGSMSPWLNDFSFLDRELVWLECVAQESLRLAQQSITLRKVMKPNVTFTVENGQTFQLSQGLYIGTLLSVTNHDLKQLERGVASNADDLDTTDDDGTAPHQKKKTTDGKATSMSDLSVFDPKRYVQPDHRPRTNPTLSSAYSPCVVSTFGHLLHACPGGRFSMAVFKIVITILLQRLEMQPLFDKKDAQVPPTSVGAIGRCLVPCRVRFQRKDLKK